MHTPTQSPRQAIEPSIASGIVTTFDPDSFDPITQALVGAEEVTDMVHVRRAYGKEPDALLQAAIERDPVAAMARVFVERERRGYPTTENALIALGFSRSIIAKCGGAAQKLAYAMLFHATHEPTTDDDQAEQQAMLENLACTHAGGEG